MTLPTRAPVPEESRPAAPPGPWAAYGEAWLRTPGRVVYLLAVFVLAMTSVGVLSGLFLAGVGMLILVIGLPVVVLSLLVARGFGVADRFLLTLTAQPPILEPEWTRDAPDRTSFWPTLTRPIRSGHSWSYLVHGMIVSPVLATISFVLTVTWLAVSLGGLTYWFWGQFLPRDDSRWGQYVADFVPWLFGGWSSWAVEVVLYLVAGILFAITLPWAMDGLARAHHAVARGMLGRWPSDDLAAEARAEAAARTAAVQAEDASLRRLERDIHDGPQQRLVRLQLDLAAVERRAAAGDADAAASLARDAREHAKAALDELRALSSGVAPPLLQDRGLTAALGALAGASPVPVALEVEPTVDASVPPEIARAAYFFAAELLTNAAKHSGAASARLTARASGGAAPLLHLSIVDDGRGGARAVAGHGLAGLAERAAGLRGTFVIDSPTGGPTSVQVTLPLPATA